MVVAPYATLQAAACQWTIGRDALQYGPTQMHRASDYRDPDVATCLATASVSTMDGPAETHYGPGAAAHWASTVTHGLFEPYPVRLWVLLLPA